VFSEERFSEHGRPGSESAGRVCAARRRPADRAGHAPCASWRRSRALKPLAPAERTRLPISLLPQHAATRELGRPPLPTKHRRCRTSKPPRKRVAPSACSLAVTSSTSSTFQPGRLSLGKSALPFSPTAAMAGARRSWRSTRPAALAPLPFLPRPRARS